MTGYAEIFGGGEPWHREQLLQRLQGAPMMGHHFGFLGVGWNRYHLYRQCADIDAYAGHRGSRTAEAREKSVVYSQ
ncbi:MAG: hypothetical protein ACLQJF_24045 [Candidatus Sulfotelmatobacter sp.]